uniref:TSC22 domain family, member 1 n=1 Tax=Gouania willdenowi TaxID=441366 RepID=A0A8C5E4D7_GOUWI
MRGRHITEQPSPSAPSQRAHTQQRKMAHHRRGSGSGQPPSTTPANPVVTNSHVPTDDYHQSSMLIQCQQPPAGSSSSLPSMQPQPGPQPGTGPLIKKKSGFQITSVTPAQISVSTNNSIAEDTESYDDLDESHTEDLSSSEILDVSLSRANDVVGGGRSSSEETLNNFHEAETPGAVSPNQPSHGALLNGTVNHHQQQQHHSNNAQAYPQSYVSGTNSSTLTSVTQKMPSCVGGPYENVSQAASLSGFAQPEFVAPGSVPGMHSSATSTTVSIVNPQTSSVSNVNMVSSANVPVKGGIGISATAASSSGFPPNVMTSSIDGGVSTGRTSTNVGLMQLHQNITMNTTATAASVCSSGGPGLPSGLHGRAGSSAPQHVSAPVTVIAKAPVSSAAAAPASTTSSRFRVVKLDSSSEPFKKGRWTCSDFYDKETSTPASSTTDPGPNCTRQFISEIQAGITERESTSGSSVSSTVTTLNHYPADAVCGGGETGGQQAQDFASPPQSFQGIPPSGSSVGVLHTQDIAYQQVKTTTPSASTSVHQPLPTLGHHATIGPPTSAVPQPQLTYAQAVANQLPVSSQGLMGVQQQQNLTHAASSQGATSLRPSEFTQAQQGVPQAAVLAPQHLSSQAGSVSSVNQLLGGPQQSQPQLHTQAQPHQAVTSSMVSHVGVAGHGQQPQSHPSHLDIQQQKPQSLPNTHVQNQGLCMQLSNSIHQSQVSAQSADHVAQSQAHNTGTGGRMPAQGVPHSQPSSVSQSLAHAAQTSALYASLPTFTTTQLQDAQRLLLQHQSALLGFPKLGGGEVGFNIGQSQETEGNSTITSALTAPAGSKTDGEEDR